MSSLFCIIYLLLHEKGLKWGHNSWIHFNQSFITTLTHYRPTYYIHKRSCRSSLYSIWYRWIKTLQIRFFHNSSFFSQSFCTSLWRRRWRQMHLPKFSRTEIFNCKEIIKERAFVTRDILFVTHDCCLYCNVRH